MIGSGGGSGFKNIAVLLTANNSNLKSVLLQSGGMVEAFDKRVSSSNKNLSTTGRLLKVGVAGGALAAGAGLAYALTQATAFDKSMRNVNSLAGLSETAFAALEDRVVAMSTKMPQSATTLADGLYDIYSSGFKGADAMKVLESSALSASAGLTTTEVSARAIAATLNAYGLQASDAADVSDVLFQTVNAGVISFDALAGNLGDVVGGAAAAKVSIDQVGSAIAAMTLAGIGGAESTTSLNQLLAKIVQPSEALSDMLGDLGYESGAAALETDGLRGVMEKLRVATGGNITTLLELFPEIRAARGALALMANEGKNYASTAEQIEDKAGRAGAAQRVFNEQMKAASNQAQLLKNQVDAVAISVGVALIPYLLQGMDGIRDLGSAIGDLVSLLSDKLGPGFSDLGSIIGDVAQILLTLGGVVWTLVEPFAELGLDVVADGFNTLMSAIEPVTDALAGNEAAIVAVGVALALYLVGGVTAAAEAVGFRLVYALAMSLASLESFTAGLAVARGAIVSFLASMGPILVVAALVYEGVSAWQAYSKAVEETDEAMTSLSKSASGSSVVALKQDVDNIKKMAKERKDAIDEYDAGWSGLSSWDDFKTAVKNVNPVRWDDALAVGEFKDSMGEIEDGAAEGEETLAAMGTGIVSLAESFGLIDARKVAELMEGFSDGDPAALAEIDGLVEKMAPQLDMAGISAKELASSLSSIEVGEDGKINTDSLLWITGALERATAASESTEGAQQAVADAFLKSSENATSAADAADALKDSLDALTGAAMGVDAAGIEWRQGLADLKASLIETGGGIVGNSLAAGENRLAIQDQVNALQDLLVAQARNGAGAGKLTSTLLEGREALLRVADAADVPRSAMAKLLQQYRLTPELVQTLIQEHGGKNVKKMLREIQNDADAVDRKKPKFEVEVNGKVAKKALEALSASMGLIDGKKPKTTPQADTKKAESDLDKLGKKADAVDQKKVDVPTSAPGADSTTDAINRAGAAADRVNGKTVTITTVHKDVKKNADGGISGMSPLPSQAKIAPGSGRGVFQWAEGETGGEAFIPLGAGKRSRSVDILGQVAAMFGYQLAQVEAFAKGGVKGGPNSVLLTPAVWQAPGAGGSGAGAGAGAAAPASGFPPFSFSYPPFKYKDFHFRKREKKETEAHYAKARAQARKEYERDRTKARKDYEKEKRDALSDAQQEYKEQKALYETSQGGGAGAFSAVAGDAAGTLGNLHAAAEARAQAAAELKARQSKDPNDTAEDYYKKPILTIKDYVAALKDSVDKTVDWGKKLSRISGTVGADVTEALRAMGADGEAYIAALADASVEDMKAMADELRKIQLNLFRQDMAEDTAAQTQFQGNLALLVSTGHADIAAQFAAMGYKDAGALAAAAVAMSPAELAAFAGEIAAKNAVEQGNIADAVQLAGLLQSSGGKLGIVGLSQKSGRSISDVVGLLQTFNGSVFSKMPPGFTAQIRADQALLDAGQQPSGLAKGGIVLGSQASKGQFYQWAEPGSGGESLIPLGLQSRSRALDLWETTGRMIGAGVRSNAGGTGGGVVVLPGAVSVTVDASGQVLSEGQVRSIATGAADKAMGRLADALTNGRR